GIALDGEYIVSSDNAVLATSVPESICIIGAGAVGVEFATFYNQLGVKVTLLEALDRVVPLEDEDVSKELLAAFKKAGIDCRLGGLLPARAAADADSVAAEAIASERLAPMDQILISRCTYSHPRIASVGLTEKQAREKGLEVKVGEFPFSAIGRAQIHGETGGFVKIVADAKTGQLLGTHIIGDSATELIAEPALTQLFQGDAWELGRNIHPHPTLSEAVM